MASVFVSGRRYVCRRPLLDKLYYNCIRATPSRAVPTVAFDDARCRIPRASHVTVSRQLRCPAPVREEAWYFWW